MKINFEKNNNLQKNETNIIIQANTMSDEVIRVIKTLENIDNNYAVLPIRVGEQVIMIPTKEIVSIEIISNELTITTINRIYNTRGVLKQIVEKLSEDDFVQISKHTVINVDSLKLLEPEFSGNMTAILTNKLKVTVSRKYLPELKRRLGM